MATEKEAPKLKANAETLRKVNKKPKRKSGKAKPAVDTPYDANWPKIKAGAEDIHEVLRSTIEPLNIGKLKVSVMHRKLNEVKLVSKEKGRAKLKEIKKSQRKEHWEAGNCYRKHIVFGLNNIYRQLEKGQLCAVLVCANISPKLMIKPLVPLCASRNVPATAIPDLGSVLQPLLNFKSCISLGLKVGVESDPSNVFHNLYCAIKSAPSLKGLHTFTRKKSRALVVKSVPPEQKQMKCEITEKEKDYSHLYIMKSEKSKRAPKKAEDFISLGNDDNLSSEKDTSELVSPFRVQYKDLKMKNVQPPAKKFRIGASFEPGYVISSVKPNPPM